MSGSSRWRSGCANEQRGSDAEQDATNTRSDKRTLPRGSPDAKMHRTKPRRAIAKSIERTQTRQSYDREIDRTNPGWTDPQSRNPTNEPKNGRSAQNFPTISMRIDSEVSRNARNEAKNRQNSKTLTIFSKRRTEPVNGITKWFWRDAVKRPVPSGEVQQMTGEHDPENRVETSMQHVKSLRNVNRSPANRRMGAGSDPASGMPSHAPRRSSPWRLTRHRRPRNMDNLNNLGHISRATGAS